MEFAAECAAIAGNRVPEKAVKIYTNTDSMKSRSLPKLSERFFLKVLKIAGQNFFFMMGNHTIVNFDTTIIFTRV
jgi:hypothetical protein